MFKMSVVQAALGLALSFVVGTGSAACIMPSNKASCVAAGLCGLVLAANDLAIRTGTPILSTLAVVTWRGVQQGWARATSTR